ncbi:class I SAM-dependent methyltransferase [Marinobacter sp.]|uniref:class I SAM-dependent methyltransferase n=1 Tax=Marinobacter sp. TaxID=50741 RepID=UPI0023572E15|nr:class I SAM-dependent methyltransferase [Marinobacter sp.]
MTECPVCEQGQLEDFQVVNAQQYLRCQVCEATLLAHGCRLSTSEERAIYDFHENEAEDPGYRKFLSKLTEPLLERLQPGMVGLDFGCGPGPALAGMLTEAGMAMSLYDPFFNDSDQALKRQYDFLTCTEVVEHLHQPAQVFRQMDGLLKPGGWLGVMTCFQTDDARFANWHYRRDPTHVVFYRERTLAIIGDQLGWELVVPRKDVALFRKPR